MAALAVRRGAVLPHINSRLRYLYDGTEESMAVPDMRIFRSGIEAIAAFLDPSIRLTQTIKQQSHMFISFDSALIAPFYLTLTLTLSSPIPRRPWA